ncbi:MAG TPA: hypothetical protein VHB48_06335 [Chitinophagaceae bacterium]|nr:hypothetical protein [Chitinophagaceae bacterium]
MRLYSEAGVPSKGDSMILLNIRNGKTQRLRLPDALFDGPKALNRLHIKAITPHELIIIYSMYRDMKAEITERYILQ